MRSDGGCITSRPYPDAKAKKREKKQLKEIAKIRRKSAKAILKDALKPTAMNPPDLDEPEDLVEAASTFVIDERSEDAVVVGCSCRSGCPACSFIHAVETDTLVSEAP